MTTATLAQNRTEKTILPTSIIPQKMNLRIRVLHAINYPKIAKECDSKHIKLLEDSVLVEDIDFSKSEWWENPYSYLFIVEDMNTEMNKETGFREVCASIRLDKIDKSHVIPIESATPVVTLLVEKYNYVLGELSSLWIDKKMSDINLVTHLFRNAIAFSSRLNIKYLLAMPPKHKSCFLTSFEDNIVDSVDKFGYLNEDYITTDLEIEDSSDSTVLPKKEKDVVLSLTENLSLKINENIGGREIRIEYDIISKKMNLGIRILQSKYYPEIAKECEDKHTKLLEEFGSDKDINPSKLVWWKNPSSYLFIVEDMDTEIDKKTGAREIGASMRLDVISEFHDINIESNIAIGTTAPNKFSFIHKYDYKFGLLSSLWVDKRFSERHLVTHFFRNAIAFSSVLGMKHIVGMPLEHTMCFLNHLGSDPAYDIGKYNYLKQNCISTDLVKDVSGLSILPKEEKEIISSLAEGSILKMNEQVVERETNLKYDIIIIPEKMNIRIRVLHAIDYPEIAKAFQAKHTKVLEEFGVKGVGSVKNKWWEHSGSYMFIAEDIDTGEIGAGMRLDTIDATHGIPMEEAVERLNPKFKEILHKYDNILAEACGWWVSKKFSERKLPANLMRTAIAVSSKLRLHTLLGFPNQHTVKITEKFGFTPVDYIEGLGKGSINYPPNSEYISTIVELENTDCLPSMTEEERDFVIWLRQHPIQTMNEEVKGRETDLEYDLRIL